MESFGDFDSSVQVALCKCVLLVVEAGDCTIVEFVRIGVGGRQGAGIGPGGVWEVHDVNVIHGVFIYLLGCEGNY